MKRIAYTITDSGVDGRGPIRIVAAFWDEDERNEALKQDSNMLWRSKGEKIVDIDEHERAVLAKLDGIDRLVLKALKHKDEMTSNDSKERVLQEIALLRHTQESMESLPGDYPKGYNAGFAMAAMMAESVVRAYLIEERHENWTKCKEGDHDWIHSNETTISSQEPQVRAICKRCGYDGGII